MKNIFLLVLMMAVGVICQGQENTLRIKGVEYEMVNNIIYEYQFEGLLVKAKTFFEIEETENLIIGKTGIIPAFIIINKELLEIFVVKSNFFVLSEKIETKENSNWTIIYDPERVILE